jgi:hypothetical protein
MIRKHFRLKKIALGLAFAAVAVPTAQASVPVLLDGHPAPVSYTAVAQQPIASEMSVQSGVPQLYVEGLRWQAMAKAYENSPGITAAGAALSNAKHSAYPVSVAQTTTSSDGFNWSDAGIGASIAFGAALMLLMAVILGRRFRSRPTGLAST